ncbi:PTS sugar transporter subunit IIA [Thiospirochaeta perfilievii]|uniref:PTS sugar transporter subunit IIA n=1 Tax=Thiospirochaeta perfilievii TaxID=252967 RepID=A0A5C1QA96_9SPIO|nr:PTS sugar transporter subunit IIA [Thiospirochaeta perfilievii]QEN03970.1 PTS sugar transporter subunit IIA [Thiospirochaeta perfilievii]
MNINKLIKDSNCLILNSKTKTESLLEIIEVIENSSQCSDVENLKKEIFYREQIMSTGIGQGIGIPHVRFEGIKEPIVTIAISPSGISDYESIDGEIVKIIVMILVGADQHKEYLRILSLLVKKIKDRAFQKRLLECKNSSEITEVLKVEDF